MKIIVDAMGGDNAPEQIVMGAAQAAEELGKKITLVGDVARIQEVLTRYSIQEEWFDFVDAKEVISNEEEPAQAVRRKKDSSLCVGLNLAKEKNSVFLSAGSTGALLTGALVYLGRIKGIKRPAIAILIPNKLGKMTMLLDAGANADCKAEYLQQFALMGSIYMKNMYQLQAPKVALLNIGTEAAKGNALMKEAYDLLEGEEIAFVGNMEGRSLFDGDCDIIVCDGFSGNVVLKTIEGTAKMFFGGIKEIMRQSAVIKLAGALMKKPIKAFAGKYDYTAYGGSPLLGVNGAVIKAHGSSDATAIKNAVFAGYEYGQSKIISEILEKGIEKNTNI